MAELLISSYGALHLFRNRNGIFSDVTKFVGLIEPGQPHWNTSSAWADYDGDGFLDLAVCHYSSWFPDVEHPCFDGRQRSIYCAPTGYAATVQSSIKTGETADSRM